MISLQCKLASGPCGGTPALAVVWLAPLAVKRTRGPTDLLGGLWSLRLKQPVSGAARSGTACEALAPRCGTARHGAERSWRVRVRRTKTRRFFKTRMNAVDLGKSKSSWQWHRTVYRRTPLRTLLAEPCGVTWDAVPEQSWYSSCCEPPPFHSSLQRKQSLHQYLWLYGMSLILKCFHVTSQILGLHRLLMFNLCFSCWTATSRRGKLAGNCPVCPDVCPYCLSKFSTEGTWPDTVTFYSDLSRQIRGINEDYFTDWHAGAENLNIGLNSS